MTNFIGEYKIHESMCDKILEYYNNSDKKTEGRIGYFKLDKDIKDSIDISVNFKTSMLMKDYVKEIQNFTRQYCKSYIWAGREAPEFDVVEDFNIQHYPPKGGFKKWHFEQVFDERHLPNSYKERRHLVFMTYLNDVTDEGETEFFYQRRLIQPKKGLTVIWPASWMHTHRGIPSNTQDKYIVTGWISYV